MRHVLWDRKSSYVAAVGSVERLAAFVFACGRGVLLCVVSRTSTVLQFLIFIARTLGYSIRGFTFFMDSIREFHYDGQMVLPIL